MFCDYERKLFTKRNGCGIIKALESNLSLIHYGGQKMRLDGFGLLVENMPEMIRFYRDIMIRKLVDS